MEIIYLIAYAVATSVIAIRTYYKKNNVIYKALWTEYAVSAIFCVICYYRRDIVGHSSWHDRWYDLSDTTLWGYALLLLCNFIAFQPFKLFDDSNNLLEFGKADRTKRFFETYALIYIIVALMFIVPSIGFIRSVIGNGDFGALRQSLFSNDENEAMGVATANFFSNICYKLCLEFKLASVFIAFGMIKEKVNNILAIILMIITFFIYYISCSSMAARGGLLIFSFCAGVIGLVFYKYLSKSAKRKVFISALVAFFIVLSFFITVSMSRLTNSISEVNPLLRNTFFYLGHGPIEFCKITGSLKEFAYGRTIIGRLISNYMGTGYSWDKIASDIGFPNIGPVFVTYLGYIYTDFGAFGCLAFTSLWSYVTYHLIKKRPTKISTIYFFLYYLSFYVTGNFTVGRLEYAALITTIIIYYIMRAFELDPRLRRLFTLKIRFLTRGRSKDVRYLNKN